MLDGKKAVINADCEVKESKAIIRAMCIVEGSTYAASAATGSTAAAGARARGVTAATHVC